MFFKATSYEPEFFWNPKRRNVTTWRMFDSKIADAYNTFERLEVAQHAISDNDVYEKKRTGRRATSLLDGVVPQ